MPVRSWLAAIALTLLATASPAHAQQTPAEGQSIRVTVVGATITFTKANRTAWDDSGGVANVLNRHRAGPPLAPLRAGVPLPFAPDPFAYLTLDLEFSGVASPTEFDTFDPTWHQAITFPYRAEGSLKVAVRDLDPRPSGLEECEEMGEVVLKGPTQLSFGRHVVPNFGRVRALTYLVEPADLDPSPAQKAAALFGQFRDECARNCRALTVAVSMYEEETGSPVTTLTPAILADMASRELIRSVPDDPGEGPGSAANYILVGEGASRSVQCRVHRPRSVKDAVPQTKVAAALPRSADRPRHTPVVRMPTPAPRPITAPRPRPISMPPRGTPMVLTVVGAVIDEYKPDGQLWDTEGRRSWSRKSGRTGPTDEAPFPPHASVRVTSLDCPDGTRCDFFTDTFEPVWVFTVDFTCRPDQKLTIDLSDLDGPAPTNDVIGELTLTGNDQLSPGTHATGPFGSAASLNYVIESKHDMQQRYQRQRDACRKHCVLLGKALDRQWHDTGRHPESITPEVLKALVAGGYLDEIPRHEGLWPGETTAWTLFITGADRAAVNCQEH